LGLRDRLDLRGKLESNLLVGDGALGPLLADRDIEHPLDEAVLKHPQRIRDLHEEYLRGAGARTTNAYAVDPTGREHTPKYGVRVARRLLAVLQPFSSRVSLSCPRPRCYASRGT
jgi:methionine synthase I (cobalamin-dependent)